jgi:hypothetical protein
LAIFPQLATLIVREHRHKAIAGDILLIGRQSVFLTLAQALALLHREGVEPRTGFLQETEPNGHYITDRCFFSMLSAARFNALDADAFEEASIVHDLNTELPEKYRGIADFIVNGSCLDDLFDPAMATRSISKMLRPGGRIIDIEAGVPVNGVVLSYSPEWFFDFYAINKYADCQVFVCAFTHMLRRPWKVYWWRPFYMVDGNICISYPNPPVGDFINVYIAEKGPDSTDDVQPIKGMYRLMYHAKGNVNFLDSYQAYVYGINDAYVESYQAYLKSARTFGFSKGLDRAPAWRWLRPWRVAKEKLRTELASRGLTVRRGGRFLYQVVQIPPRPPVIRDRTAAKGQYNQVAAAFVGTLPAR